MARTSEQAVGGRRRRPRKQEQIARRIEQAPSAAEVEGVQPLNPGYFLMERIRLNGVTKVKSSARVKPKGR